MIRPLVAICGVLVMTGVAVGAKGTPKVCDCLSSKVTSLLNTETVESATAVVKVSDAKQCEAVACSLSGDAQADRIAAFDAQLRPKIRETRETENGYALRFDADGETFIALAQWIAGESQCCGFLDYELSVGRAGGPIWFRMAGSASAKEFLRPFLVGQEKVDENQSGD